jgi:hypothetical protein
MSSPVTTGPGRQAGDTIQGWRGHNTEYKSLSHYFPSNPNVVLIDSKPELVSQRDRRHARTWADEKKRKRWTGCVAANANQATVVNLKRLKTTTVIKRCRDPMQLAVHEPLEPEEKTPH